jgi:hypothetical protein
MSVVSFEVAKLAQEKGFPLLGYGFGYTEKGTVADPMFSAIVCEAPTQDQVRTWLRDVHNLHAHVEPVWSNETVDIPEAKPEYRGDYFCNDKCKDEDTYSYFDTYEKALDFSLKNILTEEL